MGDSAAEPDGRDWFGRAYHLAYLDRVGWALRPARAGFLGFLAISFVFGPMLCAQQTVDDLRDLARNPVADAIKIPFIESINFDAGPYDRTSNSSSSPACDSVADNEELALSDARHNKRVGLRARRDAKERWNDWLRRLRCDFHFHPPSSRETNLGFRTIGSHTHRH